MPVLLTRAQIRAKVIELLSSDWSTPVAFEGRVAGGTEGPMLFHEDLGFDSLDDVEFVMGLEKVFDIDIPDNDAEGFKAIDDVLNYLCAACGANGAHAA